MLLMASTASSKPLSLIKEGVRTYPASSYHARAPLSLCINEPESHQAPKEENSLSESPKDCESRKNDEFPTQPEDQKDNSRTCDSGNNWGWVDDFLP